MTDPKEAVDMLRHMMEAQAEANRIWQRTGKGDRAIRKQTAAVSTVFFALTGRKPTSDEINAIGADGVHAGF